MCYKLYPICSLCYRLTQWLYFTFATKLISFESIAGHRLTKRPIDLELNLNTTGQHNQRHQAKFPHRSAQPTKPVVRCSILSLTGILCCPNPEHIFSLNKTFDQIHLTYAVPNLTLGIIKAQMFAVRFRGDVVTILKVQTSILRPGVGFSFNLSNWRCSATLFNHQTTPLKPLVKNFEGITSL